MRLAADASILVAESLRARGREILLHPSLDLAIADHTWSEAEHELRKRAGQIVERGHLTPWQAEDLLRGAIATITDRVTLVPSAVYTSRMDEARLRMLRDPNDAPVVALALTLQCGIWTVDHDFFGCGVAIWTTETLQLHLEYEERDEPG